MLFGDKIGISVDPGVVTIFATVMAFVLTQRRQSVKDQHEEEKKKQEKEDKEEARP